MMKSRPSRLKRTRDCWVKKEKKNRERAERLPQVGGRFGAKWKSGWRLDYGSYRSPLGQEKNGRQTKGDSGKGKEWISGLFSEKIRGSQRSKLESRNESRTAGIGGV